jgi:uncharacterized protein (TIGR00251 family)
MNEASIIVKIHLQPRAARDEICGLHGNALKVKVTAPPIEGKANAALQRFIAEKLNIPASRIEIIAGQRSRGKLLQITGISRAEVEKALGWTIPLV